MASRLQMTEQEVRNLPGLKDALAAGSKFYFEGACPQGHISRYNTSSRQCAECTRLRALQHYQDNKEEKKKYAKEYKAANYVKKERKPPNPIPYWIRNKDACRESARKSYKKNRLKRIEKSARYRARKMSASGDGVSADQAAFILAKQGGKCVFCNSTHRMELDHIVPLSRGGEHSARNVQWLCKTCNSQKNARDPIEFAQSKGRLL